MKTTILELNQRIEDAKARYAKLEKLTERVYWTDLKLHDAVAVFKHDENFENDKQKLMLEENELMSQLLELKGE